MNIEKIGRQVINQIRLNRHKTGDYLVFGERTDEILTDVAANGRRLNKEEFKLLMSSPLTQRKLARKLVANKVKKNNSDNVVKFESRAYSSLGSLAASYGKLPNSIYFNDGSKLTPSDEGADGWKVALELSKETSARELTQFTHVQVIDAYGNKIISERINREIIEEPWLLEKSPKEHGLKDLVMEFYTPGTKQ